MRVITAEPRERKPAPNPLSPGSSRTSDSTCTRCETRDRSIFYVGAGRGNKIYSHDWDALGEAGTLDSEAVGDPDRDEARLAWIQRIRDIYAAGHSVDHIVLRHRIENGSRCGGEAREAVHVVTDALRLLERRSTRPVLTNWPANLRISSGARCRGGVAVQYSALPAPELPVPGALVRVPPRRIRRCPRGRVRGGAWPLACGCRRTQRG